MTKQERLLLIKQIVTKKPFLSESGKETVEMLKAEDADLGAGNEVFGEILETNVDDLIPIETEIEDEENEVESFLSPNMATLDKQNRKEVKNKPEDI